MKRVLSRLGALLLCLCLLPAVPAAAATTTLRAVWVATIYNGDFPKTKNNAAAQKHLFECYNHCIHNMCARLQAGESLKEVISAA